MGLEPGALIGRQGECGSVGLAEAEAAEPLENLPDPLDDGRRIASLGGLLAKELFDLWLGPRVFERPTKFVGTGEGASGHDVQNAQHVLMKDHNAEALAQHRL